MKALNQISPKEIVFRYAGFHQSISCPKHPEYYYMVLEGNMRNNYTLIISHQNKGIIKKSFRLIEKDNQFYFQNGGDILFDTLDEIIIYMIERYAV